MNEDRIDQLEARASIAQHDDRRYTRRKGAVSELAAIARELRDQRDGLEQLLSDALERIQTLETRLHGERR